jgi:hypothetical protein
MFASKDSLLTRPSGGYNIARSVRLRSSATAYFNRTAGSAATDGTKWTISCWVKRGILDSGASLLYTLMSAEPAATTYLSFYQNKIYFQINDGGAGRVLETTQVFRDPSAWYHCVFVWDRGAATASQKMRLYINGTEVTSFSTDNRSLISGSASPGILTQSVSNTIGRRAGASADYFDGYITEFNAIDGQQLTPSSFGETDSITGVWKPKAFSGTYGTNGFELNFSDNSNNTAATIGKDYSGNGNNWTPNNISVTAGVTYDSMQDVPTLTSATAANYGVMNPVAMTSNVSATNGNLTTSFTGLANAAIYGTFLLPTSGKWYFESTISTVNTATSQDAGFGIVDATTTLSNISAQTFSNGVIYRNRGDSDSRLVVNGSSVVSGNTYSWSTNDVVQIAYDADSGKVWVGRNNSWFDTSGGTTGNPSSGTNQIGTLTTTINMLPVARAYSNTLVMNWNFGQRPFSYSAPTGFVALNTYNLPASTITNGAAYMAATLYTGNGSTQSISNAVGSTSFQPDFVWIKSRSAAYYNTLYDSVRGSGATKSIYSNTADAEGTFSTLTNLSSFNSNGFTVGTTGSSPNTLNESGVTFVGWQWKAGGTSASNTNGSITSTVSVGATQGFSVVTYTGTGTAATIGHGLGVAPSMIIIKSRPTSSSWIVYHSSISPTNLLTLQTTAAQQNLPLYFNSTSPTSSVFSIGSAANTGVDLNVSSSTYVAYCFAAVKGFSAFGSYTGNGSTDGPFIYTGFRPRFFMYKRTDSAGSWVILDSSRNPSNVTTQYLYPNASDAEVAAVFVDFVSNGVKFRTTYTDTNGSGFSYIYACFAESPFKTSLAR